jgi:hypothetical protein
VATARLCFIVEFLCSTLCTQSRRTAMADAKQGAKDKAQAYADAGIVGDVDFLEMIAVNRAARR